MSAATDEVGEAGHGWTDSHLHQFDIGGLTYGAPEVNEDGWSDRQIFEASSVRLADFTIPYNAAHHLLRIRLRRQLDSRPPNDRQTPPGQSHIPRGIAGSRAGPPEDVGGTSSYADFLKAWSDPLHEEHQDMRRWVGRKFDPDRFDLDDNNKAIARAIRRSKASYRFRHEN
jgi:Plasmid pRiA4b ORF-3-like protein